MLWLILGAFALLLVGPPIVAVFESKSLEEGPRDVGFWSLARSVAGKCHVPWGRGGSPVVRFALPRGEARVRALRAPEGWWVELRAYQPEVFGFAARITAPAGAPARWRAPGLRPIELFPEEREHLADAALEATDERLLRWLLRHPETRSLLEHLRETATARELEVVLSGSVIILRALSPAGIGAGDAVELMGPALVESLRALSADLVDLSAALTDLGDRARIHHPCRGCSAELGEDPWICPGCRQALHRGCREMLDGCAEPTCDRTADALPGVGALPEPGALPS